MFSAVNIARFFKVDPEKALGCASEKFLSRFERVESAVRNAGRRIEDMALDEVEAIYQQVKLEE